MSKRRQKGKSRQQQVSSPQLEQINKDSIEEAVTNSVPMTEAVHQGLLGSQTNIDYGKFQNDFCKREIWGNLPSEQYGRTGKVSRSRNYVVAGTENKLYRVIEMIRRISDIAVKGLRFGQASLFTDLQFVGVEGTNYSIADADGEMNEDYMDIHNAFMKVLNDAEVDKAFQDEAGQSILNSGFCPIQIIYDTSTTTGGIDKCVPVKAKRVRPSCIFADNTMHIEAPQCVLTNVRHSWSSRMTAHSLQQFPIVGSSRKYWGSVWQSEVKTEGGEKKRLFDFHDYTERREDIEDQLKQNTNSLHLVDFNSLFNNNGKNGVTGYYMAATNNPIFDFLILPYWFSDAAINTLIAQADLPKIKAGFTQRGFFKAGFMVLTRSKLKTPEKEKEFKDAEIKRIKGQLGADNAGGIMIAWNLIDDPANYNANMRYMQFVEIPSYENTDFLRFLSDGLRREAAEVFAPPELLDVGEMKSGFSNQAANLLFKYMNWLSSVAEQNRRPYLSFVKWVIDQQRLYGRLEGTVIENIELKEVRFSKPPLLLELERYVERNSKNATNNITGMNNQNGN